MLFLATRTEEAQVHQALQRGSPRRAGRRIVLEILTRPAARPEPPALAPRVIGALPRYTVLRLGADQTPGLRGTELSEVPLKTEDA